MQALTSSSTLVPCACSSERKTYTNIIYNNVLTAMKTLCLHSSRYGEVSPSLAEGKALIESDLKEDQPVDEVLGAHIKQLWMDPAIKETYNHQGQMRGTRNEDWRLRACLACAHPVVSRSFAVASSS